MILMETKACMEGKSVASALRRAVSVLLAMILALTPSGLVYAALPDEGTLDIYNANGIYYYNGSNVENYCGSASVDCNIIGETADERLWSGLRHVGFTPEQTAGVMGNIHKEGGHPARQEDAYNIARDKGCTLSNGEPYTIWNYSGEHTWCMGSIENSGYDSGDPYAGIGVGIVGWTVETRKGPYLELMKQAGLIKYFDGDAYKTYGRAHTDEAFRDLVVEATGSDADYWAMWCIALKHVWNEFNSDTFKAFFNKTSVAEFAGYMAEEYEKCAGGCLNRGEQYYKRIADAENVYRRYQNGEFDAVEKGTAPKQNNSLNNVSDGSNITMIGDTVLAEASVEIKKLLSGVAIETSGINNFQDGIAAVGRLKDASELRDNVIFVLGSNKPDSIKLDDTNQLMEAIGDGHNVYFVTNYNAEDQSLFRNNNAAFTAAVAEYNITIIDWANTVEDARVEHGDTAYIKSQAKAGDSAILPTAEGSKLFAEMIYEVFEDKTKPTDNCENVADPKDALSYAQQFIIDTNYLYGQNYKIPDSISVGVSTAGTPAADNAVSAVPSALTVMTQISGKNNYLSAGCWGAIWCGQCTALSGWFTIMMSDYEYGSGDGDGVVGGIIANNPELSVSNTPKAFSIFSERWSGGPHTGLVLGELENGAWLTLENNWGNYQMTLRERTDFSTWGTIFADLSEGLRLEHLGKRYD